MAGSPQYLQELIDLAKEPSSDKRRELLRRVTDLFLDTPRSLSEQEEADFSHVVGRLAYEMEIKVRKILAERLSTVATAPRELVNRLANDEIEVARPILQNSPVFKDSDLVAIVRKHGEGHMAAIAQRKKVSAEVADTLVERGSDSVLAQLAANAGASLSRTAMETMVDRAQKNDALHEPLVTRRDMPPDLMNEMFWSVSAALRQYIIEQTANIDPGLVDEVLSQARGRVLDGYDHEERELAQAAKYVDREQQSGRLTENLLVKLLRLGQVPEFIVGFARLAEIDNRTARRIVFDPSGEALAIACKANKFARTSFSTLLMLNENSAVQSPSDVERLLKLYDQLPHDAAQRTMRFWRVRQQAARQPAGPVAPLNSTAALAQVG